MPRKKTTDDGHENNRNARVDTAPVVRGDNSLASLPGISEATDWTGQAADALDWFMCRFDGWLRISPDPGAGCIHMKWKFTSQKWPNHYVYYRSDYAGWRMSIVGLARKVQMVDEGVLKPTFDSYYNPV